MGAIRKLQVCGILVKCARMWNSPDSCKARATRVPQNSCCETPSTCCGMKARSLYMYISCVYTDRHCVWYRRSVNAINGTLSKVHVTLKNLLAHFSVGFYGYPEGMLNRVLRGVFHARPSTGGVAEVMEYPPQTMNCGCSSVVMVHIYLNHSLGSV